jgi:hypothetical protein
VKVCVDGCVAGHAGNCGTQENSVLLLDLGKWQLFTCFKLKRSPLEVRGGGRSAIVCERRV